MIDLTAMSVTEVSQVREHYVSAEMHLDYYLTRLTVKTAYGEKFEIKLFEDDESFVWTHLPDKEPE